MVTEDATEPSGDASAAVETPGTRRLDDERNQATTPPFQRKERCLPVSEVDKRVCILWAGADSNCGYGHPKAEGYQATPPARTSHS